MWRLEKTRAKSLVERDAPFPFPILRPGGHTDGYPVQTNGMATAKLPTKRAATRSRLGVPMFWASSPVVIPPGVAPSDPAAITSGMADLASRALKKIWTAMKNWVTSAAAKRSYYP